MTAGTLAQALEQHKVDFSQLYRDYKPMLKLVEQLIGVVPNCDPYLEIWPTGFRTYNMLVPNLLNLPKALVGQGAPKDLVGLGMYASSRSAGCMYCSAHTCAYAIRRGISQESLTEAQTPAERAVADAADALGKIPSRLTPEHVQNLHQHLSVADAEWVALGIGLMGFLNKFMDAMGIELEAEVISSVEELIAPTGWKRGKHQWKDNYDLEGLDKDIPVDGFRRYLKVLRHGPAAARLEGRWTKGMSRQLGSALVSLEEEVGYAFPILGHISHKRVVRALATVLRDNLDAETTTVGLDTKVMVAAVFAQIAQSEMLTAESVYLASLVEPNVDIDTMVQVGKFALDPPETATVPAWLSGTQSAALILAKASSTSPSDVNEITISTVAERLRPEQTVEILTWMSVLQMFNRLYSYYNARLSIA